MASTKSWEKDHYEGSCQTKKAAFHREYDAKKLISAFECTGIFPFDRNKISEDKYAPLTVTDRPGLFN